AGHLVMDPQAAERVARVYEDKADQIMSTRQRTDALIARGAFGDCFIGQQMEKKFEDKVRAPEVGLVAILTKVEEILRNMAQAYRDSARNMQSRDEDHADRLGRIV
ncbi:hypothetical protein, partial [Saccharopolyspora thermophila]